MLPNKVMVAKINYHVHFLLKIVFNQNIINILFLQSFHFIKLPVTSMCSFLGCLFVFFTDPDLLSQFQTSKTLENQRIPIPKTN